MEHENRRKVYESIGNGEFRVSVSKYDLTIRRVIIDWNIPNYGGIMEKFHRLPITDHGIHKACAQGYGETHVQWLDGVLYCPKCDVVVELDSTS